MVAKGTHFLIPGVQKQIIFDCRSQPQDEPAAKPGRMSTSHYTSPSGWWPSQLPHIYTSIDKDFDERVLLTVTAEILKSVAARLDAGEPSRAGLQAGER